MPELSMSAAIRESLSQILRQDDRAFLMGEDIGLYGGAFKITRGFVDEFGSDRVMNTPMSEAGFISVACGAALMGSRPIVEVMFMDFILLGLDGLVNAAVKWQEIYGDDFQMPILIRCPAGGGRSYGPTHSQSFEGMLLNVPNLVIVCPSTPAAAAGLLLGAYEQTRPTVFIEPKAIYARKGPMPETLTPAPIGKGRVVLEGRDVTVITYGRHVLSCLAAAEAAAEHGISVELIDLQTLKPMDVELIAASVGKTGRGLCVEESPRLGGIGAEVSAVVMEHAFGYLEAPFQRLGAAEQAIPCSPMLEAACFPNTAQIIAAIDHLHAF